MLEEFTNEQLARELARRRGKEGGKPSQVSEPDLSSLRDKCRDYIDCLAKGVSQSLMTENKEDKIFEAAIAAIYGDTVWAWVNERL